MPLTRSEPCIYICSISNDYLSDHFNFETTIRILTLSEQNSILAKKGDKLREIALSNRLLQLFGCSHYIGIHANDLKFLRGKYGKPYLDGKLIEFSMSNGCNSVVMVIQGRPVGIDIASTKDCVNWSLNYLDEFADIFSDEEYATLQICANDRIDELFTYYWSMKEAYMKLTGTGLNTDIKSIDLKSLTLFPREETMSLTRMIGDRIVFFTSRWIDEFEIVSTATYVDDEDDNIQYQIINLSPKDIVDYLVKSM